MLIVQLCDFGTDGDAEYRMHEPSRQLGQMSGVSVIDCHFAHRMAPELAERADVLIVQFINDWDLLARCVARKNEGKVTVFEANDFFFDIHPWNPIASVWRDRTVQELYRQLLAAVDGVQTSSEALAERWSRFGARNIAVFRNHLPCLQPLSAPPVRPLTIGWAGSRGHFADWFSVVPQLTNWLADHPQVHLAVMCNVLARVFFDLPPDRYHFTPFGTLKDYFRFLDTLDIGIAPLLPTEYNRCRSDVKFLEYASRGVVGIYADLDPYRSSVKHEETGLIYQTPTELIQCLDQLCEQTELRNRIRNNSYRYVAENRMIESQIGERLNWYHQLLDSASDQRTGKSITSSYSDDSQELRPEEPELLLLKAHENSKVDEQQPILNQILTENPLFLAAIQLQGKINNDQRMSRQALAFLDKAQQIEPQNVRTLSELGRTWYLLDDLAKARKALELAILLCPSYLPAWQYLLRMLVITKSPDAVDYANRAAEQFPTCYPLILQTLDAYSPQSAVDALIGLMNRTVPTLTSIERVIAVSAFRQAIIATAVRSDDRLKTIELLRRACEFFPESPKLAGELGATLFRSGNYDEAIAFLAQAMSIHHQSDINRDEFSDEAQPPWEWHFAEQIQSLKLGGG